MVSAVALLAFAGAASAVNFQTWCNHNGFVTSYNAFIKLDPDFSDMVNNAQEVTVFIPTNDAWDRWRALPGTDQMSFTAVSDTWKYMATTQGAYTVKDLESVTSLSTMLQGQKVQVHSSGVAPDVGVYISSGDNFNVNSTVGVVNIDFNIDNGHIQLVDTVFKLPSQILQQANKNPAKSGASKTTIGAFSALSLLGVVGFMAML